MAKQAPNPTPANAQAAENKSKDDANAQTKAQDLPTATDTVRVKFLRSHPHLAYSPGEVADLPKELHDKYLEDGPFFEAVVVAPPTE